MYSSSLTMTSSPSTVVPSMRTHWPTVDRQPTMQLSSQAWLFTTAPARIVDRLMQTPNEWISRIKTQYTQFDIGNIYIYHLRLRNSVQSLRLVLSDSQRRFWLSDRRAHCQQRHSRRYTKWVIASTAMRSGRGTFL